MANGEKAKVMASERQRPLKTLQFEEGSNLSLDLPRDTSLKHLVIRMSGSVITTYGSGTPVSDAQSIMDNLVNRIVITANGGNVIKNVRPHFMQMQSLYTKQAGERRCSAGAAAVLQPTVEQGFVFGSTTQVSSLAETIMISFENVWAVERAHRSSTWLNTKGLSSLTLEIQTGSFSNLTGFGNTAPVVYSGDTIAFKCHTIEAQHVDAKVVNAIFKQTTKNISVSGEQDDLQIELSRGNKLQGLMFFLQDGAAGGATTAAGKLASDHLITEGRIKVNGQTSIKSFNFLSLQAENYMRYNISDPYVSNVRRSQGVAYLDLTQDGHLQTALDVSQAAGVDDVKLEVDTGAAANVSYTNPANIAIMTNELLPPR